MLIQPDGSEGEAFSLTGDRTLIGRTTGGMWSYTENAALAMGYLVRDDGSGDGVTQSWLDDGEFEIEVATERIAAATSIRSFYDPKNERVRM